MEDKVKQVDKMNKFLEKRVRSAKDELVKYQTWEYNQKYAKISGHNDSSIAIEANYNVDYLEVKDSSDEA